MKAAVAYLLFLIFWTLVFAVGPIYLVTVMDKSNMWLWLWVAYLIGLEEFSPDVWKKLCKRV